MILSFFQRRRPALAAAPSTATASQPASPQFSATPSAVSSSGQTADEWPEANVEDFAAWYGEKSSKNPSRFPLDGITSLDFYRRYCEFAEHHDLEAVSLVAFGRRIKGAGFRMCRPAAGDRRRVYRAG